VARREAALRRAEYACKLYIFYPVVLSVTSYSCTGANDTQKDFSKSARMDIKNS
jgi:hypothetical protein